MNTRSQPSSVPALIRPCCLAGILCLAPTAALFAAGPVPGSDAHVAAPPAYLERAPAQLEEIEIVGHPLSAEGLAQPATVLQGEELVRKSHDTLGATLRYEPGINSADFGRAVGRPVIHGLGGPRVRIMEDRIDVLDVSVSSPDHAVTALPYLIDRIEVIKGASTLLYGSGAIGGVVDVHSGRIPHFVPEQGLQGRVQAHAVDNSSAKVGGVRLDGGRGNVAWHVDAFRRDADPYNIPGFAESALQRAGEEEEAGEDDAEEEEEEARDVLPGSEVRLEGGAVGLSWIGERGFVGSAVSLLDARYGLPGSGHGHEEEEEEEEEGGEEGSPLLDLEQQRLDFELGLKQPMAGFSILNVRFGFNDYEHVEVEGSGEDGTVFDNRAWELRAELVHTPVAGWTGAVGFQRGERKFSAIGEEAFLEPVDTFQTGVFWVGERSFDRFQLEAGARLEQVEHEPSAADSPDTSFTNLSASLGAVIPLPRDWELRLQGDYSVRAPVAEELYSNGPHLVTQTFEIGDADLDQEQALNAALTLSYRGDRFGLVGTAYYTHFNDYIYENVTDRQPDEDCMVSEEELAALCYAQADATFIGLDLEAEAWLARWQQGGLRGIFSFDTVSVQLDAGNGNLPRTPPTRYGLGLGLDHGVLQARLDYLRVQEQDEVAARGNRTESITDGYNDLRAYLGARVNLGGSEATIYLHARNLTDDEQRNHVSFIKEFAPAPGRSLETGLRLSF